MVHQRFASSTTFWLKVALVAGVYLLLQAIVLLETGVGWQKFWVLQPVENFQYWDAVHYAALAVNPACGAFYPLWPALVRQIAAPMDIATAQSDMILGSELIFLGSLPLALFTFERIVRNRSLALLAFVLYALGPNAIFYAIGYTESLFSCLSLLFLLSLYTAEQPDFSEGYLRGRLLALYGAIFGLSVGLNLLRPALLQSWFAIAFSLTVLLLLRRLSTATVRDAGADRAIALSLLVGIGSAIGYGLYGLFCWKTVGSFWGPFQAQVEWGRSLAFRPWLLLLPRSLLMDLHALYLPALIFLALGWLLFGCYRQRQQVTLRLPRPWLYLFLVHPLVFSGMMVVLSKFVKQWTTAVSIRSPEKVLNEVVSFTVLYAIAFSGAHSIINFLVNSGYLYSTARHYFGSPYAFVGVGAVLAALAVPQLNRLTWVMAAFGLIWLGDQWLHYGTGQWLG